MIVYHNWSYFFTLTVEEPQVKKPRCCCSQSGHPSDSRTGFAQEVGGQDTTTGNLIPVEPTSKYQDHVEHDDPKESRKDTQTPR